MSIITAHSSKDLPHVAGDLQAQARGTSPKAVIFFASSRYPLADLGPALQAAFPESCVVGCSTAGEISGGAMRTQSVAAMFLDSAIVAGAASAEVENLGKGVELSRAFSELERHTRAPLSTLDIGKYVGIVLVDGMSGREELLMEKLGDATDVLFVGGSAGDDLQFQRTFVFANGRVSTDSAVLLLLELKNGFDIIKTQSFVPFGKTLVATKVDEARRMVLEFDRQPALQAYANALGVTPDAAAAAFGAHPLGLMVDGAPFVRSPQSARDGGIQFYCQIKEGMDLEILTATDIIGDTRTAVEAQKAAGSSIAGILEFQCILRTLQLRDENRCSQYAGLFHGIPTAGFSTYGEAYLAHMNQTSTMLLFR